jgi:hypothetical protein
MSTGEKAKEHKEKSERDSRNQEHAGSSYHVPEPDEITDEGDVSGLPWGSVNMSYMVARGHDKSSRRGGSGRGEQARHDPYYAQYGSGGYDHQQSRSYGSRGSSGGDYSYEYDDASYYYQDYDQSGRGGGSSRS